MPYSATVARVFVEHNGNITPRDMHGIVIGKIPPPPLEDLLVRQMKLIIPTTQKVKFRKNQRFKAVGFEKNNVF